MLHIALVPDVTESADGRQLLKLGRRALTLGAVALVGAIGFTGLALAAATRPTLLSSVPGDRSGFVVRPIAMSFSYDYRLYPLGHVYATDYIAGANATLASVAHTAGRIRWHRWGAIAAARAAYFVDLDTGRYIRRAVTVRAWRVRRGRYTRFTIDLGRRGSERYLLTPTRLKAKGAPHGIPAYEWCLSGPLRRAHTCVLP